MCVLCTGFVMQVHWTDQKVTSDPEDPKLIVGNEHGLRQRSRLKRTKLANQILSVYGMKLDDWHGSKYLLTDRKGSMEVVHDIGALWPAVEKLMRKKLDPLDPELLQRVKVRYSPDVSGGDF